MEPKGDRGQAEGASGSLLSEAADTALERGFKGWLARADENQKAALVGLGFALLIGPLGQGFLAAIGHLFDEASIPNSQQLEATWWLIVITLPVALPVFLCTAFWNTWSRQGMAFVVIVCVFWAVGQQEWVNNQRGDLYCYAEIHDLEVGYANKCKEFDKYGFLTEASHIHGPPEASAGLLTALAFGYTVDARGLIMALSGVLAAFCLGYLARRQME